MKLLKSRCFFTLATGLGLLTFAVILILGRDGRLDVAKGSNLGFVNSLEKEQIKRLKRIEESCKDEMEDDLDIKELEHFIVDDKNKLIYCFVPKVACTNWKRVILSLRNQIGGNPLNIKGNESHLPELFQTLNQLNNEQDVSDKLNNYLKFIFVRHPYERLLSAYRNKFERTYSNYFRVRFGRKIIKQYRANASLDSLNRGHDVTFPEFIRYVTDLNVTKNGANFNEHWRPIKQLCFPCQVNFDIVGKYETLVSDAEYTLLRAGLANKVSFPRREETYNLKPTTDLLKDYYSQIDDYLMEKLALVYKDDLQMFGYDKHLIGKKILK